jgi:hypothetical protein
VKKTSRAIVIDEGHQSYGVTAEIAARLNEKAFYHLDAPVLRMGAMDVPVPFSPALEDLTVPTPEGVVENARKLCAPGSSFMPHDVIMPAARHGAGHGQDRVLAEEARATRSLAAMRCSRWKPTRR